MWVGEGSVEDDDDLLRDGLHRSESRLLPQSLGKMQAPALFARFWVLIIEGYRHPGGRKSQLTCAAALYSLMRSSATESIPPVPAVGS